MKDSPVNCRKNMNNILENRIVKLEKQLSKNEKYGCHNNIKISGVLFKSQINT